MPLTMGDGVRRGYGVDVGQQPSTTWQEIWLRASFVRRSLTIQNRDLCAEACLGVEVDSGEEVRRRRVVLASRGQVAGLLVDLSGDLVDAGLSVRRAGLVHGGLCAFE